VFKSPGAVGRLGAALRKAAAAVVAAFNPIVDELGNFLVDEFANNIGE
jgi:hypothetical protein